MSRASAWLVMQSLKGHLLVATPQLNAPIFSRSVLLMLEHTNEGAAGVILNRPTDATITDVSERIFEERFEWEKPVSLGGPVPGPLMVLHTLESLADQETIAGVYNTVDSEKIQQLLRSKSEPMLIVANYAGWGPGQLEGEIEEDSWLSMPATSRHVFWEGDDDLWDVVIKEIKSAELARLFHLRTLPDDPRVN
jgi:putative transcriptional regulator